MHHQGTPEDWQRAVVRGTRARVGSPAGGVGAAPGACAGWTAALPKVAGAANATQWGWRRFLKVRTAAPTALKLDGQGEYAPAW
jgi:hypothetical protein